MKKVNYNLNKSINEIKELICITCKIETSHIVLTSVDSNGVEDDWFYWDTKHQIIQCQGCKSLSFRKENTNSEDHDEEGNSDITESLFPKRNNETWNSKDFFNIPYNLKRIYKETIDCYNNDNLTLCAAGIRALIEGLCKENGVFDGEVEYVKKDGTIVKKRLTNLAGKINGLYEKGELTKRNADVLHEHRFLGSEAIHDLSIPSKKDLALAIEITEHTFDSLYEMPNKASQLKYTRLRKKGEIDDEPAF